MTLTTLRYGRYTSGAPESDTGLINSGASRACVFDPASDNIWVTTAGLVCGKVSGNAALRMSVYDTDGSLNPQTRQGYFSPVTVSTVMVGGGDGQLYTAGVSGSDNGPTNAGILITAGRRYAVDTLAGSASMRHSMIPAASITADNEQFYDRAAPSNPPPTSYGAYTASVQGHLTIYLEGYRNELPLAPANGLAPTGTVSDTAPTFTANFDDLNGRYGTTHGGSDTGDRLKQYKIQLRQVGTTSLLWNQTYDANSTERANDAISRAYGGSALTRGVTYEWRVRMSDEFGAFGDYSAWTSFTPANLGLVTLDSTPTGKIETNVPDFNGRWNHQAATSMKRVQVRLLANDGVTVLQTGADYDIADVASSALPGTLFTVTWANTGFTTLAWGTNYKYQIRGYDGTQWSDYSAARSFNTDAAPSIPGSLSPAGGAIFTSLPKLTCTFTDVDDTTGTGLTGVFRITRPDTSTVDVTPTYNATTGKWEFQTTATELSAFGTYAWKATGYDGTIYSGEASLLASATFSSSATFQYASGPVVAMSAPADNTTVTSAELDVTWSVTSGGPQVKYETAIYPDGGSTPVYDSGLLTSTATTHHVPSGYLRNNTAYDLIQRVQNSTPLDGYSNIVNLLVSFTPPTTPTNFQVNPARIGYDPSATANRLTWDPTPYAAPDFDHLTIYRSADGGPDAGETILAVITSPAVTSLVDYVPASGYAYSYSLTVTTRVGSDLVESDRATAVSTIVLTSTVLTLMGNGGTYRSNLLNVTERDADRTMPESVYQSPAATKPVTVRSATRYWTSSFAGFLIGDALAMAGARAAELDNLDAAARTGIVCVRDGRGRKRFCTLSALKIKDELPDFYSFSFVAREETAAETGAA